MNTTVFFSPARPSVVRRLHEGPLGLYIDEYASRLAEQGLCRGTAMRTLRLIADLSRWIERRGVDVDQVNEATLKRYRSSRARTRPLGCGDPVALRRLLAFLQEQDICASAPSVPLDPRARIQVDYARYLSEDIGLSARKALTRSQVLKFFQRCARRYSPQHLQRLRTALCSFLRYLRYHGDISVDLSICIPRVKRCRLGSLPKYLSTQQVRGILGSCDRTTAVGKRDYAILLSLARLGLRAMEVCTLNLDDIDWQTGQLTLHAKGRTRAFMPLPHDVGQAICEYLQNGRPRSQSRRIFLRHNAPHVGFSRSGCISAIAKAAMHRAGIDLPSQGAHVFRHTLATQMLAHGASLQEIGRVLRHQRSDTTRIYAKVDLPTLRLVALPWPGGAR